MLVNGKECELIGVFSRREQESVYVLDDGTEISARLIAHKFYRVVGEFDEDGNPIYIMRSVNILSSSSPEELKKE